MSDTSPAAAPGLPAAISAFDRRSFLATLAAAGIVTGATLPADAADHPDAALFALGISMEEQREALRQAGARSDAAYAILPEEPDLPAVCRLKNGDGNAWPISQARVITENGVERHSWFGDRVVTTLTEYLAATAGLAEPLAYFRDRATKILEALAERDATIKRNEDDAGVTAADAAEKIARAAMQATLLRIAGTPARSIPGLMIKARAAAYYWCDPQNDEADYLDAAGRALTHAVEKEHDGAIRLTPLDASLCLDVMTMAFASSAPVAA